MSLIHPTLPEQLWQRFLRGDDRAFSHIYAHYCPLLTRYGLSVVPDHELVEDEVQNLFLYLYRKRDSLKPVSHLKSYLCRSLLRSLMRRMKRDRSRQTRHERFSDEFLPFTSSNEEHWIAQEEKAQQRARLKELLAHLPPQQARYLRLKYEDGLTYEEIALHVQREYQTVVNLINRGLNRMKHQVAEMAN